MYLNTSYVEVKRYIHNITNLWFIYLNTSYVEVKLSIIKIQIAIISNLNTSYVEVKHKINDGDGIKWDKFKYILCWS